MFMGKTVAAANKALTAKPRRVRVINRCSPLVIRRANPRLRHPQTVGPAAFTYKTVRNTDKFRIRGPEISHTVAKVTHEPRGVKLMPPAKNGLNNSFQPKIDARRWDRLLGEKLPQIR